MSVAATTACTGKPEPPAKPSAKPPAGPAADWPCWRGPTRDGIYPKLPDTMPEFKLLWKKPMAGECAAGVVAAAGYVVVCDNDTKADFYRCYHAATGKDAWTVRVPNTLEMDYGSGPRGTPVIHAGKFYAVGAAGDVRCLDLKSGKEIWTKHYKTDFGARDVPVWGHCTAPLLVDGKLILHPKDVVALDPDTGKTLWTGKAHGTNYSNFVAATFGGVRQVIGYDGQSLAAWALADGKRVWELEVDNSKGYVVPSPIVLGDKLLVASEDEDTRLYGFDEAGELIATPLAESDKLWPEMATPTRQGKLVLGISQGLVCLDPAAKLKACWIDEKNDAFFGLSHIVAASDRAMIFGENGHVALIQATPDQCTILGSTKITLNTWTHPAFLDNRMYLRDEKLFYCYEMVAPGK